MLTAAAGPVIVEVGMLFFFLLVFVTIGCYHLIRYGVLLGCVSAMLWGLGLILGLGLIGSSFLQIALFLVLVADNYAREKPYRFGRCFLPDSVPPPRMPERSVASRIHAFADIFYEGEHKTWGWVITPRFEEARDFSCGRALVRRDGSWMYIDSTGAAVIVSRFDAAESFFEGFAVVKRNDMYGYIDTSGAVAVEPAFAQADRFSEGRAAVSRGRGHQGKAGQDGNRKRPPRAGPAVGLYPPHLSANGRCMTFPLKGLPPFHPRILLPGDDFDGPGNRPLLLWCH